MDKARTTAGNRDNRGLPSNPLGRGGAFSLGSTRLISPRLELDYLPDPEDPRARLALALYREALGLNNDAYQYLGFFKILDILHAKGCRPWALDH